MKKTSILALVLGVFLQTFAQTGTVKGRVIDNETLEGLPNANIFIDQTTFGVAADSDGNFIFNNIPTGTAVLVFSFVGYKPYQRNVTVEEGKTVEFIIRMAPEKEELAEVEIKAEKDKKWEADLRKFQRYFLGDDRIGAKCTITNPWVLEFSEDKQTKDFLATASEPLQINNAALGYKVTFFLKDFRHSNYAYRIAGNSQFTELPSNDPKEVVQQMKYRMESYLLSQRHFFKCILDNKLKENGFQLYIEKPQFGSTRTQSFSVELGKSVANWTPGMPEFVSKGVYRLRLPDKLEIHHTNTPTDRRVYKDVTYAVSWMEVKGGFVLVNELGVPLNPGVVTTSGEMNLGKVGHMLPLNFTPGEIIRAADVVKLVRYERLREKVYVATDRPFYYPGETIRLKAYMNYGVPSLRDSLSSILHVDLFNQDKKLIQSELLKIDSGYAFGGLKIPDTVRHQVMYIRAWTKWMRNYGTGSFFVKPLYLLNPGEVPAGNSDRSQSTSGLTVKLIERDGVKALLVAYSDSVRGVIPAHLNVSVSAILKGTPVQDTKMIVDHYPIGSREPVPHSTFTHPIEYHQQLIGRVLGLSKKPMEGSVTLVLGNMEDVRVVNTGSDGIFVADSLLYYDSVTVATQVKNKRGKVEGSVTWVKEDQPFQDFSSQKFTLRTIAASRPVFVTGKDTRLLNEVTVTDKRPQPTERMPYGDPDHVLYSDQLVSTQTGMNLLNSLTGKIPGMQVITTFDENGARRKIVMRGGTTTIRGSLEPLVYINGVPSASTDGTAASILEQINPMDVERVEVITRTNAMMGSLGANGLISIFTKIGVTKNNNFGGGFITSRWKGLQNGYEKSFSPKEGQSAATVYWNPQIFLQPDSEGILIPLEGIPAGYYSVLVEGVTIYNEPVRRVQVIDF